jgi:Flp pilus assembly protein TadG
MLREFSRSVVEIFRGLRRIGGIRRDGRGVSAVEFAIIAPVFLTICTGMLKFGIAINNNLMLNNGAAQGAMNLALSRGTATPYTTTTTAVSNGASGLVAGSITTTVKINGTACTSDSTCTTALVAGATGTVAATYPCDLTVMGVKFMGSTCTLNASSAVMIQ